MKNIIIIFIAASATLLGAAEYMLNLPNQTLSATTTVVKAGVYASTDLVTVDADLVANNIGSTSTIFGVAGTRYSPVAKTGAMISYGTGDDAWNGTNNGVAWPTTRFTAQANTNCILDNLTGLIWAKNANLFGQRSWANALTDCSGLNYGGYSSGWRLPNRGECCSLVDLGSAGYAMPPGHPFSATIKGDTCYWTSTTAKSDTSYAWGFDPWNGPLNVYTKTATFYVWPVRGP